MYLYFLCCSRISPSPSVWLTSRENTWFASVTSGVCLWFYHRRKSESHVTQPHVKDCCSVGETDSGLQSNGHVMKYKPVIRLSTQTLLQKLWLLVKSDLFHWRRAETQTSCESECARVHTSDTRLDSTVSQLCVGVSRFDGALKKVDQHKGYLCQVRHHPASLNSQQTGSMPHGSKPSPYFMRKMELIFRCFTKEMRLKNMHESRLKSTQNTPRCIHCTYLLDSGDCLVN